MHLLRGGRPAASSAAARPAATTCPASAPVLMPRALLRRRHQQQQQQRRDLLPGSVAASAAASVVAPSSSSSSSSSAAATSTTDLEEAQERSLVAAMGAVSPDDLQSLLRELGVRYDPDRLAASLAPRWPALAARAARVATGLGGFAARLATDVVLGRAGDPAQQSRRAAELLHLVSALGPSFVKIGQALSARPDLLPRPYLEALSALQDRLAPFDDATAYALIEEELGAPVSSVYSSLTASPVAAASLGQVYKGVHRATGREVAVKVQRPGIGEAVAVDMVLLRRLTKAIDAQRVVSQPLTPLVDEFASRLFGELDYVQEGKNCERFRELYGKIPRVSAPEIFWDATARRVLTMSWIDGVKLTDVEAMEANGLSVLDFVDVGVQCTLEQMLGGGADRVFHADPHPGNLLACTDGRLVYLDHGLVAQAPEAARYAILAHVVHLINRDYLRMTQDYYELDFMDRSVDTRPIAPALEAFFDDVLSNSVSQLNFKALVDGLGDVLFAYPFRVPPYYALILRSLTVLEGLALSADPNYRLLARSYPFMAKRLLADPAPQLRATFEEMVVEPPGNRLRWSRLEGLLQAGAQSYDFDPSQLWLLAEWMLGGPGGSGASGGGASPELRASVAEEAARLIDAVAAGAARARIEAALGRDAALAAVPEQPGERLARQRAELVVGTLSPGKGAGEIDMPRGSGPFGMVVGPADAARVVQELLSAFAAGGGNGGGEGGGDSALSSSSPEWAAQAARLARRPEAREMAAAVASKLAQRAAARAVKLGFGMVDLATRGGLRREA